MSKEYSYDKIYSAVSKYLTRKGYENIVNGEGYFDIVCYDGDEIVFVDIDYGKELIDTNCTMRRSAFERQALNWVAENADMIDGNIKLRYDKIDIAVVGDKGLLRHHINVYGKAE